MSTRRFTNARIVDVRAGGERERDGVIPGSMHVPRTVLEWRADPASEHRNPALSDLDAEVLVVCGEGFSSSLAAATLRELGFARAGDVVGGFAAWKAAGLPVARAPHAAVSAAGLPGMEAPGAETARADEPSHPPMGGIERSPWLRAPEGR